MIWLDKQSQVHSHTATKRVGVVPKRWRTQLVNTGYRLNKVGTIPIS